MELRRLQARMAVLCLVAPHVTIEVTSLVLLVQFQQMTYDGAVRLVCTQSGYNIDSIKSRFRNLESN